MFRRYGVEIVSAAFTAIVVATLVARLPLPRAAPPPASGDRALDERTRYSLDSATIGKTTTILRWHPQPRLDIPAGGAIAVAGWAVDEAAGTPASAVIAVIDGDDAHSVRAPLGIARPDVAATFGRPAYTASGFVLTIPPCRLAAGPHRLAFRFESADGRGYFRATDDVDVEMEAGPRAC